MSRSVFPIWAFFVVALAIAAVAFGLGQIGRGWGMPFIATATTFWVAFVVRRGRNMAR